MGIDVYTILKQYKVLVFRDAYRNQMVQSFVIWSFFKYCLDIIVCKNTP